MTIENSRNYIDRLQDIVEVGNKESALSDILAYRYRQVGIAKISATLLRCIPEDVGSTTRFLIATKKALIRRSCLLEIDHSRLHLGDAYITISCVIMPRKPLLRYRY